MATRSYFVIRRGWNAANQSSLYTPRNPRTRFASNELCLLGVYEADSEDAAVAAALRDHTCYNNQHVWAETNPRAIAGLTAAIRDLN